MRSLYPSPHLLVLLSEVVLSFVTYIYHILIITLLIIDLFFSAEEEKELQGNIFYNGRGAEW